MTKSPVRSAFFSGNIKKIAIIRIGKIGDMIVSRFAMKKIREGFPDARILLVTLPRNRELLTYSKMFDDIVYFHKGVHVLPLMFKLRFWKPDLLVDFNDNPSATSSLIARFANARWSAGFTFDGSPSPYSIQVPCPSKSESHIIDRMRLIPEALQLPVNEHEIASSLDLGEDEQNSVRRELQEANPHSKPVVAINLSAGNANRYLQLEKWIDLVRRLLSSSVQPLVILLTAPHERELASSIAAAVGSREVYLPHRTDFHSFASYVAQSHLLISADTSAIHIADAFRVPVLGLYPAVVWNAVSWKPYRTHCEIVQPGEGFIVGIQVEEIWEAFGRLWSRRASS